MSPRLPRTDQLPEGTLPSGQRPYAGWLRKYPEARGVLRSIDEQQERRAGELVPESAILLDEHDESGPSVEALVISGLVSDYDESGCVRKFGVTPAGSRALERYA